MTPKETLIKAREFLEGPSRWTKGLCWAGPEGEPMDVSSDPKVQPAKCCMWGAVLHVDRTRATEQEALRLLCQAMDEIAVNPWGKWGFATQVSKFNDSHVYADVLMVFDWAIEIEEQK